MMTVREPIDWRDRAIIYAILAAPFVVGMGLTFFAWFFEW
jgi:hypothetical protein